MPPRRSRRARRTRCAGSRTRTFADFDLGVRYLQLMGVRYYARPRRRQGEGGRRANPTLREVATVPDLDVKPPIGWTIYEVERRADGRGARVRARRRRGTCTRHRTGSARAGRSRRRHDARRREFSPWECMRGPVVRRSRGPRPAAHRRRPRRLAARAAMDEARDVDEAARCPRSRSSNIRTHQRVVDRVRRVADRRPGDGEDLVLPELGGRGRRRSVAGHAELHGRRAHEQARRAHLRHRPPSSGSGRVLTVLGLVGLGAPGVVGPGDRAVAGLRRRAPARGGGYDSRPAPHRSGEDPRLSVADSRSTPSSRPTTSAGSIPTRSTSRSRGGSATPSSRSPARPGCSSGVTPARRRSRWSRRSSRARRSPAPTSSTSASPPPTSATSPPARLDAPAAMFTASHNPAQYNGVKLCRAGAAPIGQDTGLAEIKAMVAGGLLERAEDPGRVERRDLLPAFVAARPLVRRPRRARRRCASSPTPPTASAA